MDTLAESVAENVLMKSTHLYGNIGAVTQVYAL